ncbi:hypothetical protein BC937DRAFT_91116 [Endogone sp. FLAS-F59071]|nr:hypothetical protein BC937DRAFT_91116 [Endogone sp. FLAS-F59071]|eukprot:RUS16524.1 hypothetical protein BC937DRAFT_91116 [Endogone sp. FLAS-F59071]
MVLQITFARKSRNIYFTEWRNYFMGSAQESKIPVDELKRSSVVIDGGDVSQRADARVKGDNSGSLLFAISSNPTKAMVEPRIAASEYSESANARSWTIG